MQGFVQIERCVIDHLEYLNGNGESDSIDGLSEDDDMDMTETMRYRSGENLKEDEYDLILISRRGRQRAGEISLIHRYFFAIDVIFSSLYLINLNCFME